LLLFGAILATVFRRAATLNKADRYMWLAVLATWVVGSISLSLETRKATWLLLSLVVAAAAALARPRRGAHQVGARPTLASGDQQGAPELPRL
jgi:hypothetical protein